MERTRLKSQQARLEERSAMLRLQLLKCKCKIALVTCEKARVQLRQAVSSGKQIRPGMDEKVFLNAAKISTVKAALVQTDVCRLSATVLYE